MESLPDLLPIYYKKLFPYALYCKWLKYDEPESYFKNRELSFTLKDDIYLRYRSYADQQDFEKDMKAKCPYKIDIGAVYSCSPKMRDMVRAGEFVAQYKELVFDIDMTDYDDVRACCSGAAICPKCWPLMTVAVEIVDKALEEDFGFKHRLWVYSGRRGVHCWVADRRARKLDTLSRSAIADYLTLVKGGANSKKKVRWGPDMEHHSVKRALGVLDNHFREYILTQGFLDTQQGLEAILDIMDLKADSRTRLMKNLDGVEKGIGRYEILYKALKLDPEDYKLNAGHAWDELMIQYTYPRLDANVSKGVNHLLKSPFCIHPKTGRVCVPIDLKHLDKFDPFKVPTLEQLTEELYSYSGELNLLDYKKTSLREYIKTFELFVADVAPSNSKSRTKSTEAEKENARMDVIF